VWMFLLLHLRYISSLIITDGTAFQITPNMILNLDVCFGGSGGILFSFLKGPGCEKYQPKWGLNYLYLYYGDECRYFIIN
jgi:hypothetical protein